MNRLNFEVKGQKSRSQDHLVEIAVVANAVVEEECSGALSRYKFCFIL